MRQRVSVTLTSVQSAGYFGFHSLFFYVSAVVVRPIVDLALIFAGV